MAQMEGYRRKAERVGVDFGLGEAFSPFGDVVEGEIEGVENGSLGVSSLGNFQIGSLEDRTVPQGLKPGLI